MSDNRRNYSDNEKIMLYAEVNAECPICSKKLMNEKNGRYYKLFEIAHIYPANPTKNEIKILEGVEKLDSDVNSLKNALAVCPNCHTEFDKPRTVKEYNNWLSIKKNLIAKNKIRDSYSLYTIESDISKVLSSLGEWDDIDPLTPLCYKSLKVDDKVNKTIPYITKKKIKDDVVDYFYFIQSIFSEMAIEVAHKFDRIASQVKNYYWYCLEITQDQNQIFELMVNWLNEKTSFYSKRACEIVISFFVQNCEVFT